MILENFDILRGQVLMKRIAKYIISIMLCIVLVFGSAPLSEFKDVKLSAGGFSTLFDKITDWFEALQLKVSAAATDTYETADGLKYTLDSEGKATITGYTGSFDELILDKVDGYEIVEIGESAFCGFPKLKKVVVSDNVTNIANNAFRKCVSLESFTFGNNVVYIGDYAFYECASLKSIVIPESVKNIGMYAFEYCSSLMEVELVSGLRKIEWYAFANCVKLKSITIPGSVKSWGMASFIGCTELEKVVIGDGVNCIANCAFIGCSKLSSVTIPSSVTQIEANAFARCTNLINIEIPNSVTTIQSYSFSGCSGLININIPDSVVQIDEWAFSGVKNITFSKNMVAPGSPWGAKSVNGYIEGSLIYEDQSKQTINGCSVLATGDITIPSSVTCIKPNAFYDCKGIESITIPESITSIGSHAFYNVNNIKYSSLWYSKNMHQKGSPWGAKVANGYIESDLLYSDNSKTQLLHCNTMAAGVVIIPDTVIKINEQAFNGCTQITDVIVGKNVETIGEGAFSGCVNLVEVSLPNSLTAIRKNTFEDCRKLKNISIPNGVISVDDYAFLTCIELIDITIGSGVESISPYAFNECSNLKSIKVDCNNAVYDSRNNCNAIIRTDKNVLIRGCKNTIIPESITSIGAYAFNHCKELTNIIIPDSVKSIGDFAYYNCRSLISVTLPNSVTSIGNSAFAGCTFLENINIPDEITKICSGTFANDLSLKYVFIPDGVKTIDIYAFKYCYNLEITVPDSVISIGFGAFERAKMVRCSQYLYDHLVIKKYGAQSYETKFFNDGYLIYGDSRKENLYACSQNAYGFIKIPDNVISIKERAFENCAEVTGVSIGANVISIGSKVFSGCKKLESITVDDNNSVFDSRENCNAIIKSETNELKIGCKNTLIPESVSLIYTYAFSNCPELTEITIPGNVKKIGAHAFENCENLSEVTISEDVLSIDQYAFTRCGELKKIILPESLEKIGAYAFGSCVKLSDVTFRNGLKQINDYSFYNCMSLRNVDIPDSVTYIGENAFYWCRQLNNVIIGKGIKRINSNTFESCISLKNVTIPNSVKVIENKAFLACPYIKNINYLGTADEWLKITMGNESNPKTRYNKINFIVNGEPINEIVISSDIEIIPAYTFSNCTNISKITISGNVTNIGEYAFESCINATVVFISGNVKSIGQYAFNNCTRLTSVSIPNSVTKIDYNAFNGVNNIIYSDKWYNEVMHAQGSPWGAKAVDAYVEGNLYYYDSSKELLLGCSPDAKGTIEIPDTVEEVGENCFMGCDNISINFSSPANFAETAISGCTNIQGITAPYNSDDFGVIYTKPLNGISTFSIGSGSVSVENDIGILFCDRNANGTYSVPSDITYICENAFANCERVFVNLDNNDKLKSIGANAFLESGDYKDSSKWVNNVLTIGNYAVAARKIISGTFTLPDGIKGIADKCFEKCTGLTGFNCGTMSRLRFLGSKLFSGCSLSLKNNVKLSSNAETLSYVGEDLFDSRTDDASTRETKYIGNVLISVSSDVTNFEIAAGTKNIAAGAFSGCTKLQSITIPDSVKLINKNTFKSCISLSSVTMNNRISEIGANAFSDCISLGEIAIPDSVKEIGHLAFYGCTEMKAFKVSDKNNFFKDDEGVLLSKDGMTIIQYPSAKVGADYTISDNVFASDLAFYRSKNLKRIKIGNNVDYGKRNPFAACSAGFLLDGGETVSSILFGDLDGRILKSVSASVTGVFTVPESVCEIGNDAFKECSGITHIDFSKADDIDIIGDFAFYGCTGLTCITIPNTITKIGRSAFENCINLKNVTFEKSKNKLYNDCLKSIGDYAFLNCPCNLKNGKNCNSEILKATELKIGKNAFKNIFCDSVILDGRGLIYGFNSQLDTIKNYIAIDDESINVTCNLKRIGTGALITMTNGDELSTSYSAVIFGDVNGDGWYDGRDGVTVSMIANGMLTREQVGDASWMAADCNHDGKIDQADVDLLNQAGLLLSGVDQTKPTEDLLKTSSEYNEYLNLIDQSVEVKDDEPVNDETEAPLLSDRWIEKLRDFILYLIKNIIMIYIRIY